MISSPARGGDGPALAYNNKPISSRMFIISAGVIMNIILAAIGFAIMFMMGLHVPQSQVGSVAAGSPATFATTDSGVRKSLEVGDKILQIDGKDYDDFNKISLTVALAEEGKPLAMLVRHPDGTTETLHVTPTKMDGDPQAVLQIGITPALGTALDWTRRRISRKTWPIRISTLPIP